MKEYDIAVIGASTTGSYFAREMAKRGFKVLAIEKQKKRKCFKKLRHLSHGKERYVKIRSYNSR